ncbi:RsiW-degrading membrane proteinase PrsW (M82 family) [Streptomonospora nanhaiensis]|uniref:RsiW-degrading membrane proteinase PrsW (M82 family) n=1 Tax=Streptomonospora nanhaiensis TaxID=1323731 RepID=A0A853BL59_9ACTN|nr:PrsW family glutamic-type intramembrane protease [Streptomonospora nanhaiensis]NYI96279.1 RsiW-degrading membrane proteinase PrsW (M82 family) [Streptomonospora nanhaiensis]
MDDQAMITRDLALRVCANATEFDEGWIEADSKTVVPFTAPRDTALIERVVAAGRALGVDRLLVCRTRAEYAYEPVTEVAADSRSVVHVIRGWGSEPTDVLVAVEDLSAAVLVTATTLTVAAGPEDFLRPLVGADIEAARTGFAEEARETRDPELLRAAQFYNCLEAGARHARSPRGPGPDLAERLAVRAAAWRAGGAAGPLRTLRGAWTWAMLAVLLAAPFLVPGTGAAVPVAAGMLWLLAQLAWLSRSRTVAFAVLVRVLLAGALLVWPAALVENAVSAALGVPDWVSATYVAVGVEEAVKLAPLPLLGLVARRRLRRMAAVDYLLVAAASGAGFQLAESVLRALPQGPWGGVVPLPAPAFAAFLPGGVAMPHAGVAFAGHGVLTGLIGAGIGLAVVGRRRHGLWLWLVPFAAVWLAVLDHMVFNAAVAEVELGAPLELHPATAVFHGLTGSGGASRWLLAGLLLWCVLLDYRMARAAAAVTPPLPGEPPLGRLRRRAYGRAIRLGVRVPGDIAPVFRWAALVWARLPLRLALTASAMLQEFAVMLVAARRGLGDLGAAWRFLRERRAYAMGAARSGDRPWRRFPPREELRAASRRLEEALLGGAAAAAAVVVATAVVAAGAGAGWPPAGPEGALGPGRAAAGYAAAEAVRHADGWQVPPADAGPALPQPAPAYAAEAVDHGRGWYAALPAAQVPWVWAWGVALVSLLAVGWSVPHDYPRLRVFLREPGRMAGRVLGAFAPGQLPYAVAGLAGLLLPRGVDRTLRRR